MSTPNASQSRLSVGIVVLKRLSNDGRHQPVNRLAKLKPLTNGGGGHLKRPATKHFATERHRELGNRLTRARNHDKRGQFGQVGGLTPLRQRRHVVRADEIMQSGLGETRGVGADRVDGVRDAVALNFLRIDLAVSTTGKSQSQ